MQQLLLVVLLSYGALFVCLTPKPPLERQVLRFREASTGITVALVGSMHYNPSSITKATNVICELGASNQLGSVVIESCEARWRKTLLTQPSGSFLRMLLDNEMQAAAEAAERYARPVILGDQAIAITNKRIVETLKSSIFDLLLPTRWLALAHDLRRAYVETSVPPLYSTNSRLLDAGDFLNPGLLLNLPVSLLRYPLAILIKSPPMVGLGLVAFTAFSSYSSFAGDVGFGSTFEEQISELLVSGATVVVDVALLGRCFLVALLSERNKVIAENITQACRDIAANGSNEEVCVAVLGMAHLPGVQSLLIERDLEPSLLE